MHETPRISSPPPEGLLDSPGTVDFIARNNNAIEEEIERSPNIHAGKILGGDYITLYVPEENVEALLQQQNSESYVRLHPLLLGLTGTQDMMSAGIAQVQQPYLSLRGEGVLLGFVDTGIDYTMDAFRHPDGATRVRYLWDQTTPGAPPEGYYYGSEYTAAQIDEALAAPDPYALVPQRDTNGHGTFLASVAGSSQPGEYQGAAPEAEFIIVKARKASHYHRQRYLIPPEQEHVYSSNDVMLGIEYIIEKSLELGRPAAICLGMGTNYSSHDGFSLLEEYLARAANHTGVAICVAAGNEAQAGHHFSGRVESAEQSQQIQIRSVEGAASINLQIWNNGSDRLSVSVTSPTGEMVGRVPARSGTIQTSKLILEDAEVTIQYTLPLPYSGGQQSWVKVTNPTPGTWTVTVYGDIVVAGRYNAWLPITGFVHPGVSFLVPDPYTTITVPGTAQGVMTVGAYATASGALYVDSSWGPTAMPMLSPDLVAPGVNVGGLFPTGPGVMSGTSVAAAIATGAAALLLEWGIVDGNEQTLNTYLIRSYLIRGCTRDLGRTYPNDQWGYGKLNLYNAFLQLRGAVE